MAQAQTVTRTARAPRLPRDLIEAQAIKNATENNSVANYQAIFEGFADKGIEDIQPRVNVFTYNAWRALGRQVRKGESGVKVVTFVNAKGKEDNGEGETAGYKFARGVTVFHISQTDPIEPKA